MTKANISIIQKMKRAYIKGEDMPLNGHTKITLTNVITGEVKVVEEDNLVTSAVASVLAHNYCGTAIYRSLFPLRSLYSGVMCFSNAITANADNYNPPADNVNPMVAHAGPNMNDTASALRGNPNAGETTVTDTSIKYVWDWSTNQGNGTITTVCLCPGTMGNMGLKPFDATMNPMSSFGDDGYDNQDSWSEAKSKQYPFNISSNGKTSFSVYLSGTTFKEYTMRHDYTSFGIMRGTRDWQEVSNRSATVATGNNRFIFDDDTYYYIASATDSTHLHVSKVAKSDFAVTETDVQFAGVTLWTGNLASDAKNASMRIFAYDGTYLYYPDSTGNSFLKLNINTPADSGTITGTVRIDKGKIANATYAGEVFHNPVVISPGLVIGNTYIINGTKAYSILPSRQLGTYNTDYDRASWSWLVRQGAAMYANAYQYFYSSRRNAQANILCQMFLSTINVLETPVVKTNAQTMKIEYTITEA